MSGKRRHSKLFSGCPELFTSCILPARAQIPNISLANLSKMLKSFVDYNIFWGGPQKKSALF
jgi:hypothetical protein